MTPERVCYHALLLVTGDRTQLDAELQAALEAESPLSGLTLALAQCRDDNETLHALHVYLETHPADPVLVKELLLRECRGWLEKGEMSPGECVAKLSRSTCQTADNEELSNLHGQIIYLDELREMAQERNISQKAYQTCLTAFLQGNAIPDPFADMKRTKPSAGKLLSFFRKLFST